MLNQPMEDEHIRELEMIRDALEPLRDSVEEVKARRPREEAGGPKRPIFEKIENNLQQMQRDIGTILTDLNRQDS